MNFDDLLSRCDTQDFQVFLGNKCISLLSLFDTRMSSPSFLRVLVKKILSPEEILLDNQKRAVLFSSLRTREADELVRALGSKAQRDSFYFFKDSPFQYWLRKRNKSL